MGVFLVCMTNDAKKTNIAHRKYRQRIKEPLKQSPEEHQHLRDEQKRAYTHKGTKWKTRDKEGKPGDTPKVLDTEEEHSLLERQLGIKEKYVSLKSDIYSYHMPGTMLGVGT